MNKSPDHYRTELVAIPKVTQLLLGKTICDQASLNELWQGTAIALFAVVAIAAFPLFIYFSFEQQRYFLAIALLAFWAISIFLYFYMLKSKNIRNASIVGSVVCGILFFYLLTTGAANNTGIFWCYVVVPVLFQMLGPKHGALASLILLIGAALVFYLPNLALLTAEYTETQMSRFLFSFMVLSALSFVHEYSRTQANIRLNELKEQFKKASQKDSLTQLANRREAQSRLELIDRLTTDPEYNCGLIIADVDFFKKINDGFGHDCGDYVLVSLARIFERSTRQDDLVVRWGGEEFLILLPETNLEQSKNVCENIQKRLLKEAFIYDNKKINVSLSFGVSLITQSQNSKSALVKSDHALYQAKKNGRNCIVLESKHFDLENVEIGDKN